MKHLKILLCILLLAVVAAPVVQASDITNADYWAPVVLSNNSTATTNVATTANISTENFIAGNYLNSTANNTVMRNSSGADVLFMPGYTDANLWSMWVPSIGANTYLSYILYTANSTGGELRYFPGDAGMIASDNDSLELDGDFTIEQKGWVDTASDSVLFTKRAAITSTTTNGGDIISGITTLEAIDITPDVLNTWVDTDLSNYIPLSATGVIIQYGGAAVNAAGVRKNGSTDDYRTNVYHTWLGVGCDANQLIETYVGIATVNIYLVGYTDNTWTWFTNGQSIGVPAVGVWTDADVSAICPSATGIAFHSTSAAGVPVFNVRKNGSADNRLFSIFVNSHIGGWVGVDSSQIFEYYVGLNTQRIYINGYCASGATWNTNGVDISLGGVAAYADIDLSALAPNATHVVIEIYDGLGGGASNFSLREKGSTDDFYIGGNNFHSWVLVKCDENQVIEGKISNINCDFYLTGYFTDGGYQQYTILTEATGITSGEMTVATSMKSDPGISSYDSSVNIGVSMGSGMIPVRVLEKQTLSAPAGSITFSNIDTLVADWDAKAGVTSRHLVVMYNAASTNAVGADTIYGRINGDTGNNYNFQYLRGVNAVTSAAVSSGTNQFLLPDGSGTSYANAFGGGTLLIPHAFNTTNHKAILCYGGGVEGSVSTIAGRWASVSAVTSFSIYPWSNNFVTDSTFILGVVDERYLVEEEYNAGADFLPVFDTIPQDGNDMVVIGYVRSDRVNIGDNLNHEINDDVGANYQRQYLLGSGAATSAATAADQFVGRMTGDSATANQFGAFVISYSQYAEGTNDPHYLAQTGYHISNGPSSEIYVVSGRRNNVAAITKLEYLPNVGANFKAGSLFSLYRVPRYLIDRQELAAPAATITFNNIPQGYEALQLNVYARTDRGAIQDNVNIEFNGDAVAANYDTQYILGQGAAVSAFRNAADQTLMQITAATEGANEFGGGLVTINQYSSTTGHKHYRTISGRLENSVMMFSQRWESADAITKIILTPNVGPNFIAGSIFELVGVMPTQAFMIEIDGDVEGIEAANGYSVIDNANDWYYVENGSIPYMEYTSTEVNGTLQQYVDWMYGSEFYDSSYYGVEFDGVDDYITTGAGPSITIEDFTIAAWVYLDTTGSHRTYVGGSTLDAPHLFSRNNENFLLSKPSTANAPVANTNFTTGNWQFRVVTFDSTAITNNVKYYYNGVPDGTVTFNHDFGDLTNFIGAGNNGASYRWDGLIDNVQIIKNRILTDAEVLVEYFAGIGKYNLTDTTGLAGQWHLENGTGVTAYDSSGNGNDGTLTNGPTWVNGHVPLPYTETGTNPATPSFRTASSDPDVSANMTGFFPIAEAKAPAYTLSAAPPFISSAPNITGNFTTVPPTGGFPLAGVIAAVAAATGTPPQLPLLIIAGFITLAASLSMSALIRRSGSGSLVVKIITITVFMGIFVALRNFGIDFWMLVVFLIMAVSLAMGSRQLGWS